MCFVVEMVGNDVGSADYAGETFVMGRKDLTWVLGASANIAPTSNLPLSFPTFNLLYTISSLFPLLEN